MLGFPFSTPNGERHDLKASHVCGNGLGGPKPYEENLNMMSCKMSSVSPTQAVAQIEITVLPRWDVESVCEIYFPGRETNDVCQQLLKQYEVTDVRMCTLAAMSCSIPLANVERSTLK